MLLCYCGLIENQTKYLTNRFFQSHLYTWIPSRVGSVKKPDPKFASNVCIWIFKRKKTRIGSEADTKPII